MPRITRIKYGAGRDYILLFYGNNKYASTMPLNIDRIVRLTGIPLASVMQAINNPGTEVRV